MGAIGDLVVNLLGNGQPLANALNSASGHVTQFVGRVQSGISGLGGMLGKGLGFLGLDMLFQGGGPIAMMKQAVGVYRERAMEEKKLGAVLEATGQAAGFSKDELAAYAKELQQTKGYSQESTIATARLLASFTNIRGDVFKQAIEGARGLAAIRGGDAADWARQLGMALDNPTRGLMLLGKQGLLTGSQMESIKKSIAAGDMVGAQQQMLQALREHGAVAPPTTAKKNWENAMRDIAATVGGVLVPVLNTVMGWAAEKVKWLADKFAQLREMFQPAIDAATQFWESLQQMESVTTWLTQAAQVAALGLAIMGVVKLITSGFSMVSAVISMVTSPIGLVIAAALALGAVFVQCFGEGETFAEKLQSVLSQIPAFLDMLSFAFRNFSSVAKISLIDVVLAALEYFPQLEGPMTKAGEIFIGVWAGVKAFFGAIVDNMIGGVKEIGNALAAIWEGIKAAWEALKSGDWGGIGTAFSEAFTKTLAEQADVQAPNAFAEFQKAYDSAAGEYRDKVASSGGLGNMLQDEKQKLLDKIAADEAAHRQAAEAAKQKQDQEKKKPPAADFIKKTGKDKAEKDDKQFSGALEAGGKEAWSAIVKAMAMSQGGDDPALDAAERTADASERMADAMEKDEEEVDFGR